MFTEFTDFFSQIDFTSPSWDLFIVLFFIIGAFLYGFSLGRDRIIVILVSIYIALAVINYLPLEWAELHLALGNQVVIRLTGFFVLFLLLFFLFARSGLLKIITVSEHAGRWWQVLVFSILHVGLIISITLSFLPVDFLNNFSGPTRDIFLSEQGRFFWVIAPVMAMAVTKRKLGDKKK